MPYSGQVSRLLAAGYSDEDIGRPFEDSADRERHQRRSPFEVDKARIVHSSAFRRLQGKTQVIPVGRGDFYRTRLTHSLEVAQLGRGLSLEAEGEFSPDPDLVEAICLGHDIGHAPFGHRAERFLNDVMQEYGGFSANGQNLRILHLLEGKHPDGGLNLTRATLDGLVKYPVLRSQLTALNDVRFIYDSDASLLKWIKCGRSGVPVEAQIADWVDTVAYSVDDIEDNFRAGFLDFQAMQVSASEIAERASQYGMALDTSDTQALAKDLHQMLVKQPKNEWERKVILKDWTSRTMSLQLMARCTIKNTSSSEASNRYNHQLVIPQENVKFANTLKATAAVLVFAHPDIQALEAEGIRVVSHILQKLTADFTNIRIELLPRDFQELVTETNSKEEQFRLTVDFVSGMTERYAIEFHTEVCEGFSHSNKLRFLV
jgi:dGTPase